MKQEKHLRQSLLSVVLTLAMIVGLFPGMSLTAYAETSGNFGNLSWTMDDEGNMTISGNGEFAERSIDQNGSIKSVVFDEACQITALKSGCIYWGNNITSIVVNSTVELSVESDAFRWASGSGSSPISITINAPKVTIGSAEPFFAYSRQLNITVNTNELIVYKGTMSYLGQWNSNNSFAYPANSTVYTPAGYVFTDYYMQEEYDYCAQYGHEEWFWEDYGSYLTEGVDYTYNAEASSVALTSENAGTVFGGAQTSSSNAYTAPHNHSFTYSASGATITAECSEDGCTLPEVGGKHIATLTIKAPALTVYGGEGSAEATIEGSIEGVTNPSIVYKKGSETLTSAPTDAGTYTASITLGEATASVEYTIAQASTTITANPTASEINYGQMLTDSTLIGGTASVEGSFAWKDSTVTPQVSDSQTTEYDVVFTPTDGNYSIAECKVKLTVKKVDSDVTKAPGAKTLTYNGQAQELVAAGEATGGTMQYALGNETEATQPYTTSIPTATNAGTYYVWYKVVGDTTHNDIDAVCVEVDISTRNVTLTSVSDTKAYDGTALTNSDVTEGGEGFVSGEGATYTVTGSQTLVGESANVFTYVLNDGTEAGNYDITTVEGTLTVTKSDSSGEVTAVQGLVYDGIAKDLVTAGKTEGGSLMYALSKDGTWQEEIPQATDAGTYTVYYYIKGDENHNDDGNEKEPKGFVEVTIEKAAQDMPAETLVASDASDEKTSDGKISGLDKTKTYQYSSDGGKTWTDVKAGITDLSVKSGTYQVRYAEDKNHEAGKTVTITVSAKPEPTPEPTSVPTSEPTSVPTSEPTSVPTPVPTSVQTPEPASENPTEDTETEVAPEKVDIQLSVTQKGKKFTAKWERISSADGYNVYAMYCGTKVSKPVKVIKGNATTQTSITQIKGKKISDTRNFKVYVMPYKIVNGKVVTFGKSNVAHLVGVKNAKCSNVKALSLTKSTYTIKAGKTAKIKAKVTLVDKTKKHITTMHGSMFYYVSSDTGIATVTKTGKIKGIKKGTCTIYVYSINGLMKKAKITVK